MRWLPDMRSWSDMRQQSDMSRYSDMPDYCHVRGRSRDLQFGTHMHCLTANLQWRNNVSQCEHLQRATDV